MHSIKPHDLGRPLTDDERANLDPVTLIATMCPDAQLMHDDASIEFATQFGSVRISAQHLVILVSALQSDELAQRCRESSEGMTGLSIAGATIRIGQVAT